MIAVGMVAASQTHRNKISDAKIGSGEAATGPHSQIQPQFATGTRS